MKKITILIAFILGANVSECQQITGSPLRLIEDTVISVKTDTVYHVDSIAPQHIIGVSKENDIFVFGAKFIIHKYGLVTKEWITIDNSWIEDKNTWIKESYDIIGAPEWALNKLDVIYAYAEKGKRITILGVNCNSVIGQKIGNKKIVVKN